MADIKKELKKTQTPPPPPHNPKLRKAPNPHSSKAPKPEQELQKDVNWMVENYDGERNLATAPAPDIVIV